MPAEAGDRRRRRVRAEFPARRHRAHGAWRGGGARDRAEHRLCVDQRLRRHRTLCGQSPSTIRSSRRCPASPPCRPARTQAPPRLVRTILPDKLTGVVAAQAITAALLGAGAQRRRPAREAVHARRRHRLPVGLRHGQPDLRRRGHSAAGRGKLHRPHLRDGRRVHQGRGAERPGMGGPDAGASRGRSGSPIHASRRPRCGRRTSTRASP